MKCSFCGNDIRLGSIYCEKCGKATQIVPDYNVLEDDLLPQILEEKKRGEETNALKGKNTSEKKQTSEKEKGTARNGKSGEKTGRFAVIKKLWKNKKTRWACILSFLVLVILIIGVIFGLQNSYAYQYRQGVKQDKKENYEKALAHYLRAAELDDAKLEAKVNAGMDYCRLKQYEKAKEFLWEEAFDHPSDTKLFRCLILSCLSLGDYAAIEDLRSLAEGQEVLALFDEYLTNAPSFSAEEGEYEEDVELILSAENPCEIYYTLDGTDPIKKGIKYREPLVLTDGKTVVRAVCKNADGTFGQIGEKTYQINYDTPEYASVSPMQGTFNEPTYITITAEEGADIYYTWDGSDPTAASARYTEPILIPEGNNVLSVLVIDRHGISSDILRCNYKYLP